MTETKKNPIGRFIENTLVPISTGFAQNRYVRCIGTGSQNLMAIIMIGAVFNLLNSIQIDPYQNFIQATGIAAFLNAVYNACMNVMGVFMVGALVSTNVGIVISAPIALGDVTVDLQNICNMICPKLVPAALVGFVYWLLGKKGMTSTKAIFIVLIIGIVLGGLGWVAKG